ncbi:MAG TPA: hypothetical protein VI432_02395 [Candidatus Paceibacterota bacterium]
MTLPSISAIAEEKGLNLENLSPENQEEILVEAMRRDLPLAAQFIHAKAHEVMNGDRSTMWTEDPNSALGKQLIRMHASDALRPLASKYFAHGLPLTFMNCCGGAVGNPPMDPMQMQIKMQAGPIAYADC